MDAFLVRIAEFVDKLGSILNVHSTSGSLAIGAGILMLMFLLIHFIWKIAKRTIGTFLSIILIIVILISGGFLTMAQVRNVLETSGAIITEGWANASEEDGSAFIYWVRHLINNDSSDVGGFDFPEENNVLNTRK